MEPKDFGRALLRRKGTVFTAVVIVLSVVLFGSMRKATQYVATCEVHFGAILADPSDPKSEPIDGIGSLHSQLSFIKSPEIAALASLKLKGAHAATPDKILGMLSDPKIKTIDGGPTQDFVLQVADTPTGPAESLKGQRAGKVCNAVGQAYVDWQKEYARTYFEKRLKQNQTNYRETDGRVNEALNRLAQLNLALERADRPVEELARMAVERENLKVQADGHLNTRVDYQQRIEAFRNQLVNGIDGGSHIQVYAGEGVPIGVDRKKDIMLGLIIGLMFGVGFAMFREYLDDTVRDKESTQRELGIPVLANIPAMDGIEGFDGPSSQTIEAARTLRATLASLGVPHEKNVLLVTSSLAKGRASVLSSLAAAFAESGRSVLVIGSDLRGGRTHEAFGIANTVGLANVIRGQVPFEKAIRPAPGLDGVYVLPCGPVIGNPGELLSSEEMALTLGRGRRWADVVLLDAPPVLAAADSSILGAYADGVLMVLSAGRTDRRQAVEAKEQLVAAGGRVLGAVLVGSEEAAQNHDSGGYGDEIPSMMPYYGNQSYETDAYGEWYTDDVVTTTARMEPRQRTDRREPAKKTAAQGTRSRQRVDWVDEDDLPRVPRNGVRTTNGRAKSTTATATRAKKATSTRVSGTKSNGSAKATTARKKTSPAKVQRTASVKRTGVTAKRAQRPTPISQRGRYDWR